MTFSRYIKQLSGDAESARDLSEAEACLLFGAMLDGGVPDLELGAILTAYRVKTEALAETIGFHAALAGRMFRLSARAAKALPIVLPGYSAVFHEVNLLPLLALLLVRFGVPVLVHGDLTGDARFASAHILRELGIMPCRSHAQAQAAIDDHGIAFVPTAVLAPGLANLLSLHGRLGLRNSAHAMANLIDPFIDGALRVVSIPNADDLDRTREFLLTTGARALLMYAIEGEPCANPKRRPRLEFCNAGTSEVLFEAELSPLKSVPTLPAAIDAATTAAWIRQALAGEVPLPLPLVNQLACCLYGVGYTYDMNQAKAIVAVETGSLAAA